MRRTLPPAVFKALVGSARLLGARNNPRRKSTDGRAGHQPSLASHSPPQQPFVKHEHMNTNKVPVAKIVRFIKERQQHNSFGHVRIFDFLHRHFFPTHSVVIAGHSSAPNHASTSSSKTCICTLYHTEIGSQELAATNDTHEKRGSRKAAGTPERR